MKTARLLFLTMGFAVWAQPPAYSAPSPRQSLPETATNSPGKVSRRDESNALAHPGSRASQIKKANLPKQPSTNRERTSVDSVPQIHQPISAKPAAAAKAGSIQNATVSKAQPVRPPSAVRPAAPPAVNVRHRGANPAVIGGSAVPTSRNTAAINGTRMSRRP